MHRRAEDLAILAIWPSFVLKLETSLELRSTEWTGQDRELRNVFLFTGFVTGEWWTPTIQDGMRTWRGATVEWHHKKCQNNWLRLLTGLDLTWRGWIKKRRGDWQKMKTENKWGTKRTHWRNKGIFGGFSGFSCIESHYAPPDFLFKEWQWKWLFLE